MGRTSKPGIEYYPLNCDHISNKKIKLMVQDADSDGYWIWTCIVSEAYGNKGYYFDTNDKDDLSLFAQDICKKPLDLVEKVIDICLKRRLFDAAIYKEYGLLTSDRMQDNYRLATAERRRKGTVITIYEELLLIELPEDTRNLEIVPMNNDIVPRKNAGTSGDKPLKKGVLSPAEVEAKKQKEAEALALRQNEFFNELAAYVNEYGRVMIRSFYDHWSESTPTGNKMKKELPKTWETKKRLATWKRNEGKFGNSSSTTKPQNTDVEDRKKLEEKTRKLANE